ncbi:hypothetical protein ACQPWW_33900 [Micromonospora sp. CA-240977]|uniref:hypothetical protein n=1 Tax=Micromonospora sp. CA-240977 TaxID=3239957 RepID=UPI003D8F8612
MTVQMTAGDVVLLTTDASVQFLRPICVRIIRELPERITYDGWVWIEGYELNAAGDARARRELYVRREGVRLVRSHPPATPMRPTTGRPERRTPSRVG